MSDLVPSVSGLSMGHFRDAVATIYGADVTRRGVATLAPDERLLVEQASAHAWIPMTILTEVVNAWAAAAGVDPDVLTEACVRLGVRTSFATVWRLLLRVTTDDVMIARTPTIYARTRNIGELRAEMRLPGLARLTLTGWPNPTDRQLFSLVVGLEEVLEITGRRNARTNYRRTPDGAVFDLSWGEVRNAPRTPSNRPRA